MKKNFVPTIPKEVFEALVVKGLGEKRSLKALGITSFEYRNHMRFYGLKSIHKYFDATKFFKNKGDCPTCGKKLGNTATCRACKKRATSKGVKQALVEYKGGKCEKCGFDKSLCALEFHHRDPEEKDFEMCAMSFSWDKIDVYRKELDKCDLLCSNCHGMEHERLKTHPETDAISESFANGILAALRDKNWKMPPKKVPASEYVGVSWGKAEKCWVASICVKGKTYIRRGFKTELEAAIKVRELAIEFCPERFAKEAYKKLPDSNDYHDQGFL